MQNVVAVVDPVSPLNACLFCQKKHVDYLDQHRCFDCKRVQPVSEESKSATFSFFGLQPSFSISRDILTQRFFQIVKKIHPDKCSFLSSQDQKNALLRMSLVNTAYDCLQNDQKREAFLLKDVEYEKNFLLEETQQWFEVQDESHAQIKIFWNKVVQKNTDLQEKMEALKTAYDKTQEQHYLATLKTIWMTQKTLSALLKDIERILK